MENVVSRFRGECVYMHHTLTSDPMQKDFQFHAHDLCEIYYFFGGDADFVVEGRICHLEPGTLIVTDRGQTHHVLIRSGKCPYERAAILFPREKIPEGLESVLDKAGKGDFCFLFTGEERTWLEGTLRLAEKQDSSDMAGSVVLAVSGILLAQIGAMQKERQNSVLPESDKLTRAIIRFVDDHLGVSWELEDMEKALFRSRVYLNRHFHGIMGCSIWEYTMQKRILSAREVLYLSGNVHDAFRHSGFSDYSAFYRRYKKYTGVSPSEDLKRHNG